MKHFSKFFLLGAFVLGAAACQPLAEEGLDNPNYDPESQEVVTSFVFNVATQAQTKMSSGAVQAGSSDSFRGLVDAKLLTYAIPDAQYKGILQADADANKIYDLSQLATASQIGWEENRRILELSLPLKTNTLLVYGRAPQGNTYDNYANKYDCYGHMDQYSIDKASGSARFEAGHRIPSNDNNATYNKFLIVENIFAGIQTMLLNHFIAGGTEIAATATPDGVTSPYGYDATVPTAGIKWEQYATDGGKSPYKTNEDRFPLENKLGNLYSQLTTIRAAEGELRAGSGEAQTRIAQDLLTVLNEIRCASPLNDQEAVAKYFANEVYNRMLKYFTGDTNNTGSPVSNVMFNNVASIIAAYDSDVEKAFRPSFTETSELFWPTLAQCQSVSNYKPIEFPHNFDLPRGATHVAFDKEKKAFYYPQNFNVSGMGVPGTGDTYNAKSYYYPAELLYFGNSPIRTSTVDKSKENYPKGSGVNTGEWCNDGSWNADWSGNKVAAATRAVAMKYNINYGVAVLRTKVKFNPDASGNIYDNNHAVQVEKYGVGENEEPNKAIKVTNNMFALTGIIIGGQPQAIGWDHLPVKVQTGTDANTGDPVYGYKYGFVYDKAVPASAQGIPSDEASNPNYTLVYDNFHAVSQTNGIYTPEANQDKVSVALEFRNDSGMDFYGNHNLIRNGGYFYLIGMLDPGSKDFDNWPNESVNTTHIVPPYTAEGKSQKIKRVFIQDYMTKAVFTIGPESLRHAYLTVPDLRSASMTLGLSVDLSWENGIDFGEVVLGNN